jgi:hypothetical protein
MQLSHKRRRVNVPSVTTQKSQTKEYQYTGGIDSNSTNDDVQPDKLRVITDAREIQVGKWSTRKGNDLLSVPIGEAVNVSQLSTTGASVFNFNSTTWFAKKVVATTIGRLTALELNLKNPSGATGTIVASVYTDNAGSPGTKLVTTTIASSAVTSSAAYARTRSITCPDITSGSTYWLVGSVQTGGTGSYQITTTTNATTGKLSTDGGITWNAANVDFNAIMSTATASGTKGSYRLRRPNGTSYTFIAHGTTLYSVNETTGAVTAVDTGLDAAATAVRFDYVADTLRYVQPGSATKPRKYDFTTAASVTVARRTPALLSTTPDWSSSSQATIRQSSSLLTSASTTRSPLPISSTPRLRRPVIHWSASPSSTAHCTSIPATTSTSSPVRRTLPFSLTTLSGRRGRSHRKAWYTMRIIST